RNSRPCAQPLSANGPSHRSSFAEERLARKCFGSVRSIVPFISVSAVSLSFILSELTAIASLRQLVCAEKENSLVCPETVLLKLFSSPAPVSLAEREPDNVPIIGNSRA